MKYGFKMIEPSPAEVMSALVSGNRTISAPHDAFVTCG